MAAGGEKNGGQAGGERGEEYERRKRLGEGGEGGVGGGVRMHGEGGKSIPRGENLHKKAIGFSPLRLL